MTENTGVENSDVAESQPSENNEAVATPQVSDSEVPVESDQDKNWKAVREQLSSISNERDQLKNQIQDLSQSLLNKQTVEEEQQFSDDDLVEYGNVKKLVNREMEQVKKQISSYNQKLTDYERQLKYPDFSTVVTQDVLKEISKDPDFESAILKSSDPHTIVYKFAKGVYKDIVSKNNNLKRMKENSSQPSSINMTKSGSAALGKADYYNSLDSTEFEKLVAKKRMGI